MRVRWLCTFIAFVLPKEPTQRFNNKLESMEALKVVAAYRLTIFPTHDAICTNGPSLPNERPEATLNASPTALVNSVRPPRYPCMTNPERMVLTSGMPLPAACHPP